MVSDIDEIKNNIEIINRAYKYLNYIKEIHFPYYANIQPEQRINFSFPLTVFVGKNGCNKTRVLQALYGLPNGQSLSDFWFATSTDRIESHPKYGYPKINYLYSDDTNSNLFYYVSLARRTRKRNQEKNADPDYWEPTRPTKKLATLFSDYTLAPFPPNKDRHSPIEKKCIYIDSKVELSAYDIYMNFYGRTIDNRINYKENKKYIRKQSKKIYNIVQSDKIYEYRNKQQNVKPSSLDDETLKYASNILDKDYTRVSQLYHKLFTIWGDSLVVNEEYSEARSGSGELKVINTVGQILRAPKRSLILLDEPEISLHPGAQLKLLNFLLEQIIKNEHQIVLTTHSPTIVKYLPDKAIKLFSKTESSDHTFSIIENVHSSVAFDEFGEPIQNDKKNILVEDKLAKDILEAIIYSTDTLSPSSFNIRYTPGGAQDIFKTVIPSIMGISKDIFILFDGDQSKSSEELNYKNIPSGKKDNRDEYKRMLERIIKELTNINLSSFNFTKNSKTGTEGDIVNYETFLDYYSSNVLFFPKDIPEDLIWTITPSSKMFSAYQNIINDVDQMSSLNSKDKIRLFSERVAAEEKTDITFIQEHFTKSLINDFVNSKNSDIQEIINVLEYIQTH